MPRASAPALLRRTTTTTARRSATRSRAASRETRRSACGTSRISAGRASATLADSLTAKTDTLSRDPWALAARSIARTFSPAPSKFAGAEATRLAQRAFSLAPQDPDLAWLVAHSLYRHRAVHRQRRQRSSRSSIPLVRAFGNPVEMQTMRASAMFSSAYPQTFSLATANQGPDTAKRAAAMRAFAEARAADSTNFDACSIWRFAFAGPTTPNRFAS